MIPPPPYIDAGPYRVRVTIDAQEMARINASRFTQWLGVFIPREGRIVIDGNLSLPEQVVCLWHECKHLAFRVAGGLPELDDKADEDTVIELQEGAEADILRRNPRLLAFICQEYPDAADE